VTDGLTRLGLPAQRPRWEAPALLGWLVAATALLAVAPPAGRAWLGALIVLAGAALAAVDFAGRRRSGGPWAALILPVPGGYLLVSDIRPALPFRPQPGVSSPTAVLVVALTVAILVLAARVPSGPGRRSGPVWTVPAAERHLAGAAAFALGCAGGLAAFAALTEAVVADLAGRPALVSPATPAYLLVAAAILAWRSAPGWSRGLTGAATVAAGGAIAFPAAWPGFVIMPADPESVLPFLTAFLLLTAAATAAHPGARGMRPARSAVLTGAGLVFAFLLLLAASRGGAQFGAASMWRTYESVAAMWTVVPLVVVLVGAVPAVTTTGARLGDAVLASVIAGAGAYLLGAPAGHGWFFITATAATIGALLALRRAAGRRTGGPHVPTAQAAAPTG
jgi:hypothetical protein